LLAAVFLVSACSGADDASEETSTVADRVDRSERLHLLGVGHARRPVAVIRRRREFRSAARERPARDLQQAEWHRARLADPADRLVDTGYRVLQYERVDGPDGVYVPEMVELLRAEGVGEVVLVGGPIGGMVSITRRASDSMVGTRTGARSMSRYVCLGRTRQWRLGL
jgi:hypothetical protein